MISGAFRIRTTGGDSFLKLALRVLKSSIRFGFGFSGKFPVTVYSDDGILKYRYVTLNT